MNLSTGESNYRGTNILLPTNKSGRSTSKVEAVHSVVGRRMYTQNNIREIYWDAQVHWELINYNRRRLAEVGKDALPLSVALSEMVESTLVKETSLRFGFDYCRHVLSQQEIEIYEKVVADLKASLDFGAPAAVSIDGEEGLDRENDDGEEFDFDDEMPQPAPMPTPPPERVGTFVAEIPDGVDLNQLRELEVAFDADLEATLSDLRDHESEFGEHYIPTELSNCLSRSRDTAARNGIDIDACLDEVPFPSLPAGESILLGMWPFAALRISRVSQLDQTSTMR